MNLDQKRWLILLAGILANLCQGAAYASSVFAKPMLTHLGCLTHKLIMGPAGVRIADPTGAMVPDMKVWATVFSINLACLPIGMLLTGKLTDQRKSRLVIVLGGAIFSLGMLLAAYSTSLLWFKLTFGIMMGLGSGAAYGAVVTTSVRWFPDRRGLASGLAVGALGFGSFVIAPVAVWLMNMAPDQGNAVLFTFKVLGVAFLAIFAIASLVISNPTPDYKPAGFNPKSSAARAASKEDLAWTQMITRNRFWLLFAMYACGAFSGLMIISQASPIAQAMTADIKSLGDPKKIAEAAAGVAAILGLANAGGRVLWGFISDRIGRLQSLALMFLITAVAMFLLPKLVVASSTLYVAVIIIGICYGGYLGTFPSLCADAFGAKNMSINYGLLFSAFAVAAIAGPYVGAEINKVKGSYGDAFLIAGAVAAVGFILTLIAQAEQKRKVQAKANV